MDCCQCQGIEAKFDKEYAEKKLRQYRRNGPKKTTIQLIEALKAEGTTGSTLLDIGGGVGDIQHALLSSGIHSATNVEASSGYIEVCREEARYQGHSDKITHIQGDYVDLAPTVPPADIVTLDRVICCYHDMVKLVELSTQKARRLYGVVYPRHTWWVKLGNLLFYNLRHWLQRNPMRNYVHPTRKVEEVIHSNGLKRCYYREMGAWQVAVFCRT